MKQRIQLEKPEDNLRPVKVGEQQVVPNTMQTIPSLQSPQGMLSLQRQVGNQALVGLLDSSSPTSVQREGNEGLSLKQKKQLFESGGSSLDNKQKNQNVTGLGDRIISFKDALKIFQDLQRNPKAVEKEPEPQERPSDVPQVTTTDTSDTTATDTTTPSSTPIEDDRVYDTYQEVTDKQQAGSTTTESATTEEAPKPELESFGGGSFSGKELKNEYIYSEKENLNKTQKGLAFGGWTPSAWKARYIKYLSEEERTGYELKLLKDKGSTLFFLGDKALDTTKMVRTTTLVGDDGKPKSGAGKMIFVMDVDGRIYVADEGSETATGENVTQGERWRFNHSSFVQGNPIAAAGEMWFTGGVLKGISDESGHYWPGAEEMLQLLRNLRNHGVSLRGVTLSLRGKEMDAEIALEQNQIDLTRKSLKSFDEEISDFNYKAKKGSIKYKYADAAIRALAKAHENNPGIDLRPKAMELLAIMKPIAGDVQSSLNDSDPDPADCADNANTIWWAVETIDKIDTAIISVDGYNAADHLDNFLAELREQDEKTKDADPDAHPTYDFGTARTLIGTVVASLANAQPKAQDDAPLDELDDKETSLQEVKDSIPDAARAIDKLQNGKGRAKLSDLESDHADIFQRIVAIAAARINLSLPDVLKLVQDDIVDDKEEPDKDDVDVMNALVPGSAAEFIKSVNWQDLKKGDEE